MSYSVRAVRYRVRLPAMQPDANLPRNALPHLGPNEEARSAEDWRPVASLEDALDNAPPGQNMTLQDPGLRR